MDILLEKKIKMLLPNFLKSRENMVDIDNLTVTDFLNNKKIVKFFNKLNSRRLEKKDEKFSWKMEKNVNICRFFLKKIKKFWHSLKNGKKEHENFLPFSMNILKF